MFINYAQQQRKHCNVQSRTDSQSNRPSARAEGTIVVRIRIVDLFLFKLHTPGVQVVPLLWYVLRTRPNVTSRSCTLPLHSMDDWGAGSEEIPAEVQALPIRLMWALEDLRLTM